MVRQARRAPRRRAEFRPRAARRAGPSGRCRRRGRGRAGRAAGAPARRRADRQPQRGPDDGGDGRRAGPHSRQARRLPAGRGPSAPGRRRRARRACLRVGGRAHPRRAPCPRFPCAFSSWRAGTAGYDLAIAADGSGGSRSMTVTERLTEGVRTALAAAGLPAADDCAWEVPRQAEHGAYATNVAMTLPRAAKRPPRQVAELIVKHFPSLREVERLDVAGPGFLNVFLSPAWCTGALGEILEAGDAYGRGEGERGRRVRLEFVSANPTRPVALVSARAAAVGDSLARLLRAQGAQVTTEFYVNDAGTQFEALARSLEARVLQELGQPASLPANGYPGDYLVDLASEYLEEQRARGAEALEAPAALVTEAG